MASAGGMERRLQVKRPWPHERATEDFEADERRKKASKRKQFSRAKQKEAEVARAVEESREVGADIPDREKRRLGLHLATSISRVLNTCPNSNSRKSILGFALSHSLLKGSLPDYILPVKVGLAHQEIVAGVTKALEENKSGRSKVMLATKHTLLTAAVSAQGQSSRKGVADALNVHPRNIGLAVTRREGIAISGFCWSLSVRKKREDGIPQVVRVLVLKWWAENTRVSPNRKDVTRKRIGSAEFDDKPTHYLMESQVSFFLRFKAEYQGVEVGQRSFENLKPFFIKLMKERNTCCCIYHVEIDELRIAIYHIRKAGKLCQHASGECTALCDIFARLTTLWVSIVCPKEESDEWHKLECLLGQCSMCGVDRKMVFCEYELQESENNLVEWKRFSLEETVSKKGKVSKKLTLIYQKTPPAELIQYFKPKLQFFVQHNFVARWQDQQFKNCLRSFPTDSIVSIVDFAENYTFEIQNEVQSMHWFSYQISILVHICMRHNPDANPFDEDTWLLTEYHFYITADKHHDTEMVQHCFNLHWNYLIMQNRVPKRHFVWSDGCAAQFKSSKPWYFVSKYPSMTNGCKMLWSFFGSAHGKGPHDGAGAVVKRVLRKEQLNAEGVKLTCAADVVKYLREYLTSRPEQTYTGSKKPVKRIFWHIEENEVKRNKDRVSCATVHGTMGLHSIYATNKTNLTHLLVKNLSCFCCHCLDGDWDSCQNLPWTGHWCSEHLQPKNMRIVREKMHANWDSANILFGSNGDDIAATLETGDNFAVNAAADNEEGVDFYIICCIRGLHVVREAFTDAWGTSFEVGDMVVLGKYYQKWGRGDTSTYVINHASPKVYMHSEHVRAIKFLMNPKDYRASGNCTIYDLPSEAEACKST